MMVLWADLGLWCSEWLEVRLVIAKEDRAMLIHPGMWELGHEL